MKVIITGGSGLLGRALTEWLIKDGYEVVILSREPARVSGFSSQVKVIAWDGETVQGWGYLIESTDVVINLTGESIGGSSLMNMRWTPARKQRILESRVNAGGAITQAIIVAKTKPRLLIQVSAVGYYGIHGDHEIAEDAAPGNDFLSQVCVAWENSTEAVEGLGVRRAIVRLGVVLDRENFAFKMLKLPFSFFAGGPIGSGKQFLSWIHVDDFVNAIVFLINKKDVSGAYNLTAPQALTNRNFARVLGKVMHRPSWLPVPAFAMRLGLGEVSTIILDGQRVVPGRLLKEGYQFRYAEAEKALKQLLLE